MNRIFILLAIGSLAAEPFDKHGKLRIAKTNTYIEHTDGTPFFVLADTCWTGPALSTESDWAKYLAARKAKGFTAIQFNMVSPWRTAPTDAEGNTAYSVEDGKLKINEAFYNRVDARLKAINDAGLLAMPVLCWAHKKGDAGLELSEDHLVELIRFEVARYQDAHVLWILAGDSGYATAEGRKWMRIGRAVFERNPHPLVTTHPTGLNFPWKAWEDEKWLTILGYQSGHGDNDATVKWLHSGPAALYGQQQDPTRPMINLEPPYENHNGYHSKKPHSDDSVRRAIYWSLLIHPPCGVTYGGHGVWSWHTQPGKQPTDHSGSGVAKVWSEALDLPGAGQMKHLRTIFDGIDWPNLFPRPSLLAKQPGEAEPAKFIAIAQTHSRKQIVAYVPIGAEFRLDAKPKSIEKRTWFNPRDGTSQEQNEQPNTTNDWLLVIRQ